MNTAGTENQISKNPASERMSKPWRTFCHETINAKITQPLQRDPNQTQKSRPEYSGIRKAKICLLTQATDKTARAADASHPALSSNAGT
jgi:hypothetical protein